MNNPLKNFLTELFFPSYCVNCEKEGEWLCSDCEEKIIKSKSSFCFKCNTLTDEYKACNRCKRNSSLKGVLILGYYSNDILRKAIWDFKFNFIKDIGFKLGEMLAFNIKDKVNFKNSAFIEVPLSKKRFKWRSFNQAEILSLKLSEIINIPYIKGALRRIKETQTQLGLSRKERIKNISSAFRAVKEVPYKKVFLVDDVLTTGATLEECAKELRKAGVKEVWGVVLAKD